MDLDVDEAQRVTCAPRTAAGTSGTCWSSRRMAPMRVALSAFALLAGAAASSAAAQAPAVAEATTDGAQNPSTTARLDRLGQPVEAEQI